MRTLTIYFQIIFLEIMFSVPKITLKEIEDQIEKKSFDPEPESKLFLFKPGSHHYAFSFNGSINRNEDNSGRAEKTSE